MVKSFARLLGVVAGGGVAGAALAAIAGVCVIMYGPETLLDWGAVG